MPFLILGYGKFGRLALERVIASIPGSHVIVVDRDEEKLSRLHGENIFTIVADCVQFLVQHPVITPGCDQIDRAGTVRDRDQGMNRDPAPSISFCPAWVYDIKGLADQDVVIPMVPVHVAAKYLDASNSAAVEIALPSGMDGLPNPFRLDESNMCCSRAHFLCPDDCPEGDRCRVTGEPRDPPLFAVLEALKVPGFTTLVLPSRQILPGVGGYTMGELRDLKRKAKPGRFLVATSCRCHGILTAIQFY